MDDFEKELKVGFLDEAAQAIVDVQQCFLDLEANPSDKETLNKIFRLAHNLKGSSKAVGFDQMGAFTHELETFILKVQKGELPTSADVISLLLRCTDFVNEMIEALKVNLDAQFDIQTLMTELVNFKPADGTSEPPADKNESEPAQEQPVEQNEIGLSAPAEPQPEAQVQASIDSDSPGVIDEWSQTLGVPASAEASAPAATAQVSAVESESVAAAPAPVAAAPSATAAAVPAPTKGAGGKPAAAVEESIRVSVSKVEALLNSIGEMVILQSVIREQAMLTESMVLKKSLHQFEKVTKEVQDLSMSLRMVPVKPTFQKMQRIVRDTAKALNKDVGITLVGEDTELDKTVLEKINDPLVHLVRNSVDHGIENAETRKSRGKAERGEVRLAAFHKSGKLVIEVSDDGGGLDPEKLKKKAIEKGVLRPDAVLSDREAYNLIFAPGFSTKEAVTDVSGRGVGMDVVRTNILDLSGEINILSELGKGSTMQIVLPLTLAIIEGMIVTFGADRYVVPFSHVFETLRPGESDVQYNVALGQTLMLRGENMPIYRLGDFFGRKSTLKSDQMIAMVIRTTPKPFALLVDDILGLSQVVVKQLGQELQNVKGVSGCTILGDGKPAIILEPIDLIKRQISPMSKPEPVVTGGKSA